MFKYLVIPHLSPPPPPRLPLLLQNVVSLFVFSVFMWFTYLSPSLSLPLSAARNSGPISGKLKSRPIKAVLRQISEIVHEVEKMSRPLRNIKN